jgi:hypothetical protein
MHMTLLEEEVNFPTTLVPGPFSDRLAGNLLRNQFEHRVPVSLGDES